MTAQRTLLILGGYIHLVSIAQTAFLHLRSTLFQIVVHGALMHAICNGQSEYGIDLAIDNTGGGSRLPRFRQPLRKNAGWR